jgi:hypothetical protein
MLPISGSRSAAGHLVVINRLAGFSGEALGQHDAFRRRQMRELRMCTRPIR